MSKLTDKFKGRFIPFSGALREGIATTFEMHATFGDKQPAGSDHPYGACLLGAGYFATGGKYASLYGAGGPRQNVMDHLRKKCGPIVDAIAAHPSNPFFIDWTLDYPTSNTGFGRLARVAEDLFESFSYTRAESADFVATFEEPQA